MLLDADETYRSNLLSWVPISPGIAQDQSGNIFVNVFDSLGLEDNVSWTVRISPSGSAYCGLQQSYETGSETWYSLQGGHTELVEWNDRYESDSYSLYYGLGAYARRVWSGYSRDAEGIRQTGLRKLISSRAVSMAGRLRYLLPTYEQETLEAKAEDEVVHFESVILAEEHGRLNRFRVAVQTLCQLSWSVCKSGFQKRSLAFGTRYWRTFFSCVRTSSGIDFAVQS